MLAIVLAVINLPDLDPDPIRTPSAHIGQRLTGGSEDALQSALAQPGALGSVTIAPVCSYGTPQLTSNLLSDAADLARPLGSPACAFANDGFTRDLGLPAYAPFVSHAWATAPAAAFAAPRAMPALGTFRFVAPVSGPRFAAIHQPLPSGRAMPAIQPLRAPGRTR